MRRSAIIAAAAARAVVPGYWLVSRPHSPMERLARATPERTFAPRLSIDTEYRPCDALSPDSGRTVPRGACESTGKDVPELYGLARLGESIDPDTLQASALATLIWWHEKEPRLNASIERLGQALRVSPRPAPLLVDLSAAYLVRAERTDNSLDLVRGLNYAYQALARDPRNGPARFNAALALQMLGLDEQAALEWKAFLAVDSTSPWAREARRRMRDLITGSAQTGKPALGASSAEVRAFAEQHPQQARELGMDSILGEWGTAVERGRGARGDSLLNFADSLGRAVAEQGGGDLSLADAVLAIRQARSDARAWAVLARAHQDYAQGQAAFATFQGEPAVAAFARVIEARPRSAVLLQWVGIFGAAALGYTERRQGAYDSVLARLVHVNGDRYPALAGRGYSMLGVLQGRGVQAGPAQVDLQKAMQYLGRARESESLAKAGVTYAETAHALGDTAEAYRSMHRVVQSLRHNRLSRNRHVVLIALGRIAGQDGMPYAAWAAYNEDMASAAPRPPIDAMHLRLMRSQLRKAVGDSLGAARDLASARTYLAHVPEGWHVTLAKDLFRLANPVALSATQMDSVVDTFAENVAWLVPALLWRAEQRLTAGEVNDATADLYQLTDIVDRLTLQQDKPALRAAIMEQARSIFDRLVMVYLRNDAPQDALRTLERGRMSFAPQRPGKLRPGEGRLAAPPGHVAVEYALIGDTLLTWTIDRDSIRLWSRTVDRDAFVLSVEQARAALETRRAPVPREALQRLYDWLIRPIRNHLGARDTPLIILADGEVAGVPFPALLDGERYLIEDHPLRFAATLEDAAQPARKGSGPALLMAPSFAADAYPDLDSLPGAVAEVQALGQRYPGSRRLEGDNATRSAFIAQAPRASLIHYAGHAVFNDARPERSFLLLAGPDTTGRLTAEAVSSLPLDSVRLVVLSACSTLRARSGRSGGFAGLSGALLAAGAGGVLGSLWKVDDQLAQPLMAAFHDHLRHQDPALALRQAQLDMLHSGHRQRSAPAAWAGFRYAGN